MKILIVNGPNLNLLGTREPEKYGSSSFVEYLAGLRNQFPAHEIEYFQSNIEGELINAIHSSINDIDGIILNAAGYTHTSVSIRDAIASIKKPVIEVHITNIHSRETFRHTSLISGVCKGTISGFGLDSYRLAVISFLPNQENK